MNADEQRRFWGLQALMNAMAVIQHAAPSNLLGEEISTLAKVAMPIADLLRHSELSSDDATKLDEAIGHTNAMMRAMETASPSPRRGLAARLLHRRVHRHTSGAQFA